MSSAKDAYNGIETSIQKTNTVVETHVLNRICRMIADHYWHEAAQKLLVHRYASFWPLRLSAGLLKWIWNIGSETDETSAPCQEVGIKKINYTGSDHWHKACQELNKDMTRITTTMNKRLNCPRSLYSCFCWYVNEPHHLHVLLPLQHDHTEIHNPGPNSDSRSQFLHFVRIWSDLRITWMQAIEREWVFCGSAANPVCLTWNLHEISHLNSICHASESIQKNQKMKPKPLHSKHSVVKMCLRKAPFWRAATCRWK